LACEVWRLAVRARVRSPIVIDRDAWMAQGRARESASTRNGLALVRRAPREKGRDDRNGTARRLALAPEGGIG